MVTQILYEIIVHKSINYIISITKKNYFPEVQGKKKTCISSSLDMVIFLIITTYIHAYIILKSKYYV